VLVIQLKTLQLLILLLLILQLLILLLLTLQLLILLLLTLLKCNFTFVKKEKPAIFWQAFFCLTLPSPRERVLFV
ncbi:MAG: hypothetical protein EOP47_27875, partial [Sphingobacteriaceae bacterium]